MHRNLGGYLDHVGLGLEMLRQLQPSQIESGAMQSAACGHRSALALFLAGQQQKSSETING